MPALDQAVHGLPARGHFAVRVGPARPAGELRVGDAPRPGFGSRGRLVMCRTRPITRPSKMATPSVPGALSGKVRRQVMLVALRLETADCIISSGRLALFDRSRAPRG